MRALPGTAPLPLGRSLAEGDVARTLGLGIVGLRFCSHWALREGDTPFRSSRDKRTLHLPATVHRPHRAGLLHSPTLYLVLDGRFQAGKRSVHLRLTPGTHNNLPHGPTSALACLNSFSNDSRTSFLLREPGRLWLRTLPQCAPASPPPHSPFMPSAPGPRRSLLILFLKNFIYLYFISRFLLVIYFIHISVYMSIPISQFITPPPLPPPPLPLSPLGVRTFVLYIGVSISALQTGSSVPFF